MTEAEKIRLKNVQKRLDELYELACQGQNVAGQIKALEFRIEVEFFDYDGD